MISDLAMRNLGILFSSYTSSITDSHFPGIPPPMSMMFADVQPNDLEKSIKSLHK